MRLVLWLNNVSCCTGRSFPAVTFLVIVAIVSAPARPAYCYPSPRYTESWAVEVRGGREAADKLAKDHGFTNLGEVMHLLSSIIAITSLLWERKRGVAPSRLDLRVYVT